MYTLLVAQKALEFIRNSVIYRYSGILSAFGMALADVVHEAQEPAAFTYVKGQHGTLCDIQIPNMSAWHIFMTFKYCTCQHDMTLWHSNIQHVSMTWLYDFQISNMSAWHDFMTFKYPTCQHDMTLWHSNTQHVSMTWLYDFQLPNMSAWHDFMTFKY